VRENNENIDLGRLTPLLVLERLAISFRSESADRFIDDFKHLLYMIFMVFFVAPPVLPGTASAAVAGDWRE
jgi:hypothetical protein